MEKKKKPSIFKKAGDQFVRYYKKVRYARFVPFYIVVWAAFGAIRKTEALCPRTPCSSLRCQDPGHVGKLRAACLPAMP